jgi:glycosyltransferase involved in cell wall biosynthesis
MKEIKDIILNDYEKVMVVIPSYNPSEALLIQVAQLKELGFYRFIIVDDGSSAETKIYFEKLLDVKLISNKVNKGKGDALKCAFKYIIQNFDNVNWVVTCDDDGQHHPEDVRKVVSIALVSNSEILFLGSRDFGKQMPIKSLIGNTTIRKALRIITDKKISDTQTGLRVMPVTILQSLIEIPYNQFNFEFACLLFLIEKKFNIVEVPIKTIYFNNNRNTRFKGISDSLKVLKTLLNYYIEKK